MLFLSCSNRQCVEIDPKKVIGNTTNSVPYGEHGLYGYIFINGERHTAAAFSYNNKALVYVLDKNSFIMDYYFSSFIDWKVIQNIPLGENIEDIITLFGTPAFGVYCLDDICSCPTIHTLIYLHKAYNGKRYVMSTYTTSLVFNSDNKLILIRESRQWS